MVDQDHQLQKKEEYAMSKDNVLALRNPGIAGEVSDVLTQVLREGAQQMLARAIEAEVAEFLERYRLDRDQAGRARMVRNGYLPARMIQMGGGRGWHQSAADAGSGGQDPLYLCNPAAVFATYQDHRGTAALVVLERHLDRRFF